MANHPSAEKRHRQSVKRAARNQAIRTRVRSAVKKLRGLISTGDSAAAKGEVGAVTRALDKAVSKGVLHRNNASRRASRLAKQVAKLG
jgi:small subunit ribosomal protein S20